jgi:hypothetical protein
MRPAHLLRAAIILKPATIRRFHRELVKRKYRLLFTPKSRGKPGPKGPSPELISAILEMKRRNPNFGYQRIAELIVPRHDEALLLICRSVNRMLVSCPVFQPGHSHSMNQDNASYLSNALLKAVGI